ncbi:MAG: hypothetical protein K8F90_09470, partial [Hyphomicrobiales bacterium]|nr:hypothetical protein [Hyphomicrobiales bacterium]
MKVMRYRNQTAPGRAQAVALIAVGVLIFAADPVLAQNLVITEYAQPTPVDSRLAVWVAAQLHLDFAAFVLAVPMFALAIEAFGWRQVRRDPEAAARYDWLAHEMARLL